MEFTRLRIDKFRNLDKVDIHLDSGLNFFIGSNGAGKTSLIEAAYLLSHARSFRPGHWKTLIQHKSDALVIHGDISNEQGRIRLGLERTHHRWRGRVNQEATSRLADLLQHCAVICFEPGSHALISGVAEKRRQFLDWGVFHVEHSMLSYWQRYRRAIKQRNYLLRQGAFAFNEQSQPWNTEVINNGERIHQLRSEYLVQLEHPLHSICNQLLPELGKAFIKYYKGWPEEEFLAQVLERKKDFDLVHGYTSVGIHRADWRLSFENAPQREHLSRGQQKLSAVACLIAQAQIYADMSGHYPVLCFDDLSSELDQSHQHLLLELLMDKKAQLFITDTNENAYRDFSSSAMFHVEHGRVIHVTS